MEIEMITTNYNGVQIVFLGVVFEDKEDALLISGKIPFVNSRPVKQGEWIRKDTIQGRIKIGEVVNPVLYGVPLWRAV